MLLDYGSWPGLLRLDPNHKLLKKKVRLKKNPDCQPEDWKKKWSPWPLTIAEHKQNVSGERFCGLTELAGSESYCYRHCECQVVNT